MKRFLKIFGIGITVLFVVLLVMVQVFLTEEKIREFVIKPIESTTAYRIDFKEFDAGFLSGFHVELSSLDVRDTTYKNFEHLAELEQVRLDLKLLPLITGSLEIDEISVVDGDVNIEIPKKVKKKSQAKPKKTAKKPSAKKEANTQEKSEATDLSAISINIPLILFDQLTARVWVEESDLNLTVADITSKTEIHLENNNLEVVSELDIDSIGINMAGSVYSSVNQSVALNLAGNLAEKTFNLNGTKFVLAAIPGEISGSVNAGGEAVIADLSIRGRDIQIADILQNLNIDVSTILKSATGELSYDVKVAMAENTPNVSYSLDMNNFDITLVEQNAHISKIAGNVSGDLNKANLTNIHVIAEDQQFRLNGTVDIKPSLAFDIKSELDVDLTRLRKFNAYLPEGFTLHSGKLQANLAAAGKVEGKTLPRFEGFAEAKNVSVELADLPEGKMDISGRFDFSNRELSLKRFAYNSVLTDVAANFTIRDYFNLLKKDMSKTSFSGKLTSEKIDVTPYVVAAMADTTTPVVDKEVVKQDSLRREIRRAKRKKRIEEGGKPLDFLEKLQLSINANIGMFKADNIKAERISAAITNRNRMLTTALKNVSIFSGNIKGNATVDYREIDVHLLNTLNISNMNLNTMATEVLDVPNTLYGKISANGKINLTMPQLDSLDMKQTRGNFNYSVIDGKLANIPALKKLAKTVSVFDFDTLRANKWTGELTIADEKVRFSKITIASDDVDMIGENAYITFDGRMNFPLTVTLSKSKTDAYAKSADSTTRGFLDLLRDKNGKASLKGKIIGPYNSPDVALDWSHAQKNATKKAKKKVETEVKKKAKKLLKKWF